MYNLYTSTKFTTFNHFTDKIVSPVEILDTNTQKYSGV